MAEKELETVENPQEVEASQPEKEEKMVSVAEMQRRLKQMEENILLKLLICKPVFNLKSRKPLLKLK